MLWAGRQTTLVIACLRYSGLAIPLSAIPTALGARNGLLVKVRRGLDEERDLDAWSLT